MLQGYRLRAIELLIVHVQDAPLVVMNNFGGEEHLKLATALFQTLFPAINVQSTSLKQCKVSLNFVWSLGNETLLVLYGTGDVLRHFVQQGKGTRAVVTSVLRH